MFESAPAADGTSEPFSAKPVMFNYTLAELAPLVSSEQLKEWEDVLREKLGESLPMTNFDPSAYFGGATISFLKTGGTVAGVPEITASDSDYNPTSHQW